MSNPLHSRIAGTGSYLPPRRLSNADLVAQLAGQGVQTSDSWIVERTGIHARHFVDDGVSASDLALQAAQRALAAAGAAAGEVDLIIVATSTPDMVFPSTASILQHKLGIAGCAAFDVQAVCSGFVYALSVADAMVRAGNARCALVVGAEVFSRLLDFNDRTTCVLFGDGAGAVVLRASDTPGILASDLHADGKYVGILCVPGCRQAAAESGEVVEAANFNDPKQTVISGSKAGVAKACEVLKAMGAKRTLPLPVSAPFHCSLMKPAAERLRERLSGVALMAPVIAVVNNVDVSSPTEPAAVADALYRQAFGAVRWAELVAALQARGITHFVECGPGRVLAGILAGRMQGLPGMSEVREVREVSEVSAARSIALVTGASRGIGRAISQALAQAGHLVIGTATTPAGAESISEVLKAFSGCAGICLNVTDAAACDAALDSILKQHGGLHVLVNNAGITRDTLAMRMKDDDWDAVLDTNLKAVFRLSRAVMRPMMKQRFGRIINITSVVGASGNAGQANYAAAKAGVAGLTRALARELGSRNITVNCVAPGFIATDMTDALADTQKAALLQTIPLGRLGSPQEVAHAVTFLASPLAGYITGEQLHVNGGMFMN
ncbi:hypothetical protein B566_EDAN018803 [Ephemera danica]|nr:hypothetical protein B566_EDAN018803 [Ephemera danica]